MTKLRKFLKHKAKKWPRKEKRKEKEVQYKKSKIKLRGVQERENKDNRRKEIMEEINGTKFLLTKVVSRL